MTRPTRDIDLLGRISGDPASIHTAIATICQLRVPDDGLVFDETSVATERITEDADYEGLRATFRGYLGNARIAMQVDMGFSDAISPGPMEIEFPVMLGHPKAQLRAYNRETTISEKLEAMVKLGKLNSRMKDFFDIWLLAENFPFEGPILAEAVRRTFERRGTELELNPICLTDTFAVEVEKAAQWTAFRNRTRLADAPNDFPMIIEVIRRFLQPLLLDVHAGIPFKATWHPGGSWIADAKTKDR